MRYFRFHLVGVAFLILGSELAYAQLGPGMGGPMGPGMPGGSQQPSGEEKKEGVAEAAPKTPGLLPTTPALPPPKGRRKRFKLLEMGGYFRLRTDWFKDFSLGYNDDPALGGAPFPRALGCGATNTAGHPCDDSLGDANMRLRLEPVLNIDEGTSVHVQADVFDNTVLGSTPSDLPYDLAYGGVYGSIPAPNASTPKPPVGAFSNGQAPQLQGVNSDRPSIVVKRAWGEVAVPLGVIKFGRQPNQWGMGVYANAGGYDPINGTYDYDADYGDSVDRVSFSAQIPGTSLRAMIAHDWIFTGLTSNQTSANIGHTGAPYDLDDSDDMDAWVGVLSKMDSPQEFRDAVDRGEAALNYGVYFEYKNQAWAENLTGFTLGNTFDSLDNYVPRGYKTYTTSLWGKLGLGNFLFETEIVGILGSLQRVTDVNPAITQSLDVRKFGGVGRMTWRGIDNKLHLGLESGFATGDQWDNTPQGNTNVAFANTLGGPGDSTLTQFIFNRAYTVDMILWRRLEGAVNNAVYAKPFLQYDLTKSILVKVSNITSWALSPVATPGNDIWYGTEFDSEVGYHTDKMYAGFAYGVLFPFGAMTHKSDTTDQGGPGYGWGTDAAGNPNTGDPSTAHCIQMKLMLMF